jgi:acetyl-CoA acyltransferase
MIADKWGISRDDCDAFSVESHLRAARATDEGRFQREIVPVLDANGELMTSDEGFRRESSMETLGKLKPAFRADGKITAGNSSQITDGAGAVLIMSEEMASKLGLRPMARFHTFALAGVDPVTMLTGPIPATAKALEKSGLKMSDIDLFEVNEAFAPVVLAWQKEHDADLSRTNVNGGAIALGHPLGGSGARIMATMVHELERIGGRYALQTMCEGGGLANATIIERL